MSIFSQSFTDQVAFQPQQFNPVVLAGNERTKVILACFEPGQFIPVYRPGVDLTLVVLEGEGQIVAGEEEQRIGRRRGGLRARRCSRRGRIHCWRRAKGEICAGTRVTWDPAKIDRS